ncbi:hypothetical protein PMIN06_001621 [Paraphaeosphaeria minitans]
MANGDDGIVQADEEGCQKEAQRQDAELESRQALRPVFRFFRHLVCFRLRRRFLSFLCSPSYCCFLRSLRSRVGSVTASASSSLSILPLDTSSLAGVCLPIVAHCLLVPSSVERLPIRPRLLCAPSHRPGAHRVGRNDAPDT